MRLPFAVSQPWQQLDRSREIVIAVLETAEEWWYWLMASTTSSSSRASSARSKLPRRVRTPSLSFRALPLVR